MLHGGREGAGSDGTDSELIAYICDPQLSVLEGRAGHKLLENRRFVSAHCPSLKASLLEREDCFLHLPCNCTIVVTLQVRRRSEGYLHLSAVRPSGVSMQDSVNAPQPNRNNGDSEPRGDQSDTWLKRLDLSCLCSFTFREEQYGPIVAH